MTQKEVLEVLQHIVDSDEKCATDVMYALVLLSTNVNNMLESVKNQMRTRLEENRFDDMARLTEFCNHILELNDQIEICIENLIRDSENSQKTVEKNIVPTERIDYSKYTVDPRERHTLDEDFKNRKICAFRVYDTEVRVDSWRGALLKFCGEIGKQNIHLLESMVDNPDFRGRKNTYFLKESVPERNERIPGTDIYVWTNLSANDTVNLIRKILGHIHVSEKDFIVFLRADYSELHQD